SEFSNVCVCVCASLCVCIRTASYLSAAHSSQMTLIMSTPSCLCLPRPTRPGQMYFPTAGRQLMTNSDEKATSWSERERERERERETERERERERERDRERERERAWEDALAFFLFCLAFSSVSFIFPSIAFSVSVCV